MGGRRLLARPTVLATTVIRVREDIRRLVPDQASLAHRTVSAINDSLSSKGCDAYVKTIYVGYTFAGAMVAAVYPTLAVTELALALPEDFEGADLVDATHLTWPTMPVALRIAEESQLSRAVELAERAADRVANGQHDVARPPDFFSARERVRWGRSGQ